MNDKYPRYICELCIVGLTFLEAMTLVLRDNCDLSNIAVSKRLSEILNKDISPQASANFYRKARIKLLDFYSTYSPGAGKDLPDGAESDPSVTQSSQKVTE